MTTILTKRDLEGADELALLALDLQGDVPREYADLLDQRIRDNRRERLLRLQLDLACKAAQRKLRREAKRILGTKTWGIAAFADDASVADIKAIVDHSNRPRTSQASFSLRFWMNNGGNLRIKSPNVEVSGLLIRGREITAQLRALRAAADAYTETLMQALDEVAKDE